MTKGDDARELPCLYSILGTWDADVSSEGETTNHPGALRGGFDKEKRVFTFFFSEDFMLDG